MGARIAQVHHEGASVGLPVDGPARAGHGIGTLEVDGVRVVIDVPCLVDIPGDVYGIRIHGQAGRALGVGPGRVKEHVPARCIGIKNHVVIPAPNCCKEADVNVARLHACLAYGECGAGVYLVKLRLRDLEGSRAPCNPDGGGARIRVDVDPGGGRYRGRCSRGVDGHVIPDKSDVGSC